MVRRWSCINLINSHSTFMFRTFQAASSEVLFKENLSFKKELRKVSFMTRKSWSRRKHMNQWLIYHNILVNWASDYRFFKRYTKAMLVQNLFTNSFLTYNFLMLRNTPSTSFKGAEHFLYSFTTKKVYNYFLKYQATKFNIFNLVRNYNLIVLTQPSFLSALTPTSVTHINTTYKFSQNTLFSPKLNTSDSKYILDICNLLNYLVIINSTNLYKVLTLLTLSHSKSN